MTAAPRPLRAQDVAAGLRPLRPDDVAAAARVAHETFAHQDRELGHPASPYSEAARARGERRLAHLLTTDPGGAWVTERDGAITGVSASLVRDGIWGLSLLTVLPGHQSAGAGRALFDAALTHGDGGRGGIIVASPDARALRSYRRAGFALHPAFAARGTIDRARLPATPDARPGTLADLPLTASVDREIRGADHLPDWELIIANGDRLLVIEDRGYVILSGADVYALAARDERAARELLIAALAEVEPGDAAVVTEMTSAQQWAIEVCIDAGLAVAPDGAVCLRGELGPLQPYLPSGAFL